MVLKGEKYTVMEMEAYSTLRQQHQCTAAHAGGNSVHCKPICSILRSHIQPHSEVYYHPTKKRVTACGFLKSHYNECSLGPAEMSKSSTRKSFTVHPKTKTVRSLHNVPTCTCQTKQLHLNLLSSHQPSCSFYFLPVKASELN